MPQLNKFEIEMFAKRAAQDLLEHGRDLNDSILEIAGVNDMSREQVKRIVEAANTVANGELVKRAKVTGNDPRVSFKLADSTEVFSRMIAATPEAKFAALQSEEKLASMFKVPVVKPVIEKTAARSEPRLSNMKSTELAAAYVQGQDVTGQSFTEGQLADAIDDLSRTQTAAREKWAQLALAEGSVLASFERAVEREIHTGLSPATIKVAMVHAPVCAHHLAAAGIIIDAKAQEMGRDAGRVTVKTSAIIDERSDIIVDLTALLLIDAERDIVLGVSEKIADAQARASADLNALRAKTDGVKLAFDVGTALNTAQVAGKKVKGALNTGFKGVGLGLSGMQAASHARAATQRLKQMQMTPAVGPMKMAAEKLAGMGASMPGFGGAGTGFFDTLKNLKPGVGSLAAIALATGAAAAGAAGAGKVVDLASKSVGSIFENRRRDKLFEQIVARDPMLKQNARAREYFDLVLTYAPALGDHPTAIGDFLKRQLQYPVSGVEFLGALAKLQKDISDARRAQPSAFTSGVNEAVHGAQGQWLSNAGKA